MTRSNSLFRFHPALLAIAAFVGLSMLGGCAASKPTAASTNVNPTVPVNPRDPWIQSSMVFNPVAGAFYATNYFNNTIDVINGTAVVDQIPVASSPIAIAINPQTNLIYAVNDEYRSLFVINGATNKVVATISVGVTPAGVAVNSVTNKVYVTDAGNTQGVIVLDGTTNKVTGVIDTKGMERSIAVNSMTNTIYAENGTALTVINGSTNVVTATIAEPPPAGGERPANSTSLAVNESTNTVYMSTYGATNVISVIDGTTNQIVASIAAGNGPAPIAVDSQTNMLYVLDTQGVTVAVIDGTTNNAVATITLPNSPVSLAVNPIANLVYVPDAKVLSIVNGDTNTVAK